MPEDYDIERNGLGRRTKDRECVMHEERIDLMDKHISRMMGWVKGAGVVCSLVAAVVGFIGTGINSKLAAIEMLLTDSKVTLMKHEQQIIQIQAEVKEITDRHRFIDQNIRK